MRLYAYRDRFGDERFGVLVGARLLTGAQLEKRGGLTIDTHLGIGDMIKFEPDWQRRLAKAAHRAIKAGAPLLDPAKRQASGAIHAVDLGEKIVGIGLNYADHAAEGGRIAPERPLMFAKFANALVGDGDPVIRHAGTQALDLEVELGVVIGRRARRIPVERAMACVAGYVVANDISARDWQGNPQALPEGKKGDGQWLRAKGADTFLPVGPVMVTADEVDPTAGLRLRSWLTPSRGPDAGTPVLMQDGTTANMIHGVAALIAMVSESVTLEAGDLVITGTPAGVGVFRDPPVFLQAGDVVRCEIDGIGSVSNPIIDWTEDTRFEA
jgi:2-keto-4-pentenoate hydratase/2-oxohepta-3-ene-1,7-dioic acid hydratase in catechol pathway